MAFSKYPKFNTEDNSATKLKRLSDPSAGTRFILHSLSAISSLALLLFIFTLNKLNLNQIQAFQELIQNIPFLDIQLSTSLAQELSLSRPITIIIVSVVSLYAIYAVLDIGRKRKPRNKISDRSFFSESSDLSYAIHILLLLAILLSSFLNYHPKPKVKITEIEYIPSQIESPKKPPQTKRKAEKQSVNSGKKEIRKAPSPVQKPASKAQVSPSPEVKPEPVKQEEKPKASPAASPKTLPSPAPLSKPQPRASNFTPSSFSNPKPQASPQALPREALQQSRVNPNASGLPSPRTYSSTGGLGSSSTATGTSPAPKYSSNGAGDSSNLVARIASIPRAPSMGGGGASGGPSNPESNSNPNGPASLAAMADIEFGPYMSALQRKIKMAWKPPRGTESNRIVVKFSISKTGYLQDIQLISASRSTEANNAALEAIKKASPFDPLPAGSPASVDIEFTFDYNVFKKERW